MPDIMNSEGGANALPPIPKMDAPQAARDAATEARTATEAAVREAVRSAVQAAKAAGAAPQAPAPQANPQSNNPVIATTTTAPQPPFNPADMIPPQAVEMTEMFFLTCVVIIIGWPLARAFARFIDRRAEVPKVSGPDITPQIRQLQESVDSMAIELERISESQRFQTKLMAAVPAAAALLEGKGQVQN